MEKKKVEVMKNIYEENEKIAGRISADLTDKGIFAVNIMGSPGAGKTSVIKRIVERLRDIKTYVVEADIESDIDTKAMEALGIEAYQINTGGACHLDAPLLASALEKLDPKEPGVMMIENVGNLVCPAEFVIGEHAKLLVISVPEGSDKPYKYPLAFEKADMILLTKSDLFPFIDFDRSFFYEGIKALNKNASIFEVSSKTGEGFDQVAQWFANELTS